MVPLRVLLLLAIVGSLLSYGVSVFIFVICGILSFSAGFFIFLPEVRWASLKQKIKVSSGLVKPQRTPTNMTSNFVISGCPQLDSAFNQILGYVVNDYVRLWYVPLTSEADFLHQLHAVMAHLLAEISKRTKRIDWVPFIIEEIPNLVIEHLRIHRKSLEKHAHASQAEQIKLFFDEEFEMEKLVCREGICTSREKELNHLRRLTDVFLFAIMPEEDYSLSTFRYLLKEIFLNGILVPTVDILADPDFVNQSIIRLCNESACTSPYFIQSLRMSTRKDELEAVVERIEAFAVKLRGRDSGGDNDTLVKAQLNSLNFLENVCNSQIAEIKHGIPRWLGLQSDAVDSAVSSRLVDLTFNEVMASDIAVSNFLEFLTSINKQSLFSLYLNCVAYRVNAEALMTSVAGGGCSFEVAEETDIESGDGVSLDFLVSSDSESQSLSNASTISEEDKCVMEGIREFGVSMCNSILRTLPHFSEETVHHCLRTLTTPIDSIDPNVFVEVEEELVRMLSDQRCFGAFKRSQFYNRALNEIELPEDLEGSSTQRKVSQPNERLSRSFHDLADSASAGSPPNSLQGSSIKTSAPAQSMTSQGPLFSNSYSATILCGEMIRDAYVVYTVEVVCTSTHSGQKSTWKTYRRFSQFDDLHSCIMDQCGRIPGLKLPPKKSFSTVSQEFIERRRQKLANYLQTLCSLDALGKYSQLHPLLVGFLQPENWERKKAISPGVSTLINPLKAVGSAIISVPDSLFDGFSKMLNRKPQSQLSGRSTATGSFSLGRQPITDTCISNLTILDQSDSDNISLRLLFMLVDEIFNLQRKTQPFLRGTLTILRNIAQTFFGDIMNRRIIEWAKHLISSKQIATYAEMLRDVLWPNGPTSGSMATSPSLDTCGSTTQVSRDDAMKLRTRVLCRAVMFGSVAEELASYLGVDTTREGVQRVFDLLQQPCLNRRLVHCLLERITQLTLNDYRPQLSQIYAQDNGRISV